MTTSASTLKGQRVVAKFINRYCPRLEDNRIKVDADKRVVSTGNGSRLQLSEAGFSKSLHLLMRMTSEKVIGELKEAVDVAHKLASEEEKERDQERGLVPPDEFMEELYDAVDDAMDELIDSGELAPGKCLRLSLVVVDEEEAEAKTSNPEMATEEDLIKALKGMNRAVTKAFEQASEQVSEQASE